MLSGEELESERRHKDLAELVGHRHSDRDVQFGTYLNINDRELRRKKKQHECAVKFKKRASL